MSIQKMRMAQLHGARRRQMKLFAAVGLILAVAFWGGIGYVAIHFITKYW